MPASRPPHVLIISFAALLVASNGATRAASVDAVWLYGFQDAAFDNNEVVGFLRQIGINRVHLSMGGVPSHRAIDPSSASFDVVYTGRLDEFISLTAAHGIDVHAMTLEDPSFTMPANHAFGQGLIANILAYNSNHPGASFDGLHIDVEPWTPAVWTGHATPDYAQLEGLVQNYRALLGLLRGDLDTHETNTGQDLEFSAAIAWWFNEQAALGNVPSADAALLAQDVDTLVPLVFDGIGATATEIINRTSDELDEVRTLVGIGAGEIGSWQGRLDALAALDAQFSSNANYVGTSTFHYDPLLIQFQAAVPEPSGLALLALLLSAMALATRSTFL